MPFPDHIPNLECGPEDRIIWHQHWEGDHHCKQIWRLDGPETDGWNLWDVYEFEIVKVHWHNNEARTEITMRYVWSYWHSGRYDADYQRD